MRAVSFLGAAAFCVTASAAGAAGALGALGTAGAGLSGTVGRAPRVGGFGGGFTPLRGLAAGSGEVGKGRGAGGGTKGLGAAGGAPGAGVAPAEGSLVVSFFGAGLPGTLIRTVSRFTAG